MSIHTNACIPMPICGPYCDCLTCVMDEMFLHPLFREKLHSLVHEYRRTDEYQKAREEKREGRERCIRVPPTAVENGFKH